MQNPSWPRWQCLRKLRKVSLGTSCGAPVSALWHPRVYGAQLWNHCHKYYLYIAAGTAMELLAKGYLVSLADVRHELGKSWFISVS